MGLKLNKQAVRNPWYKYKSDMRYYLLYIVISVPFILLFYDTFNINANIFSTENLLLGLNPYSHQSLLVIGYTAMPYNYFLTLVYNWDGYNTYFVVIIIKLIAMFFTIASASLIYKILLLRKVNVKNAKAAMLAFLFSPFIIFVDYIWVQPEFYSIFFLLLGIYAFERYRLLNTNFVELIMAAFSLLIAGITFYFPLLLIPGYFIYTRGKIPKVKFLIALIIAGSSLLLPIVLFNLKTTFSSTLAGKNIFIYPFSLMSLFLKQTYPLGEIELIVEVVLIMSAIVVPLVLNKYKKSMFLSQFIILALIFSLQIAGINPDTFIFLVPFLILEYCLLDINNISIWRLLLLQMILLPEYFNIQLLDGPGTVTGIYYWIYFWYHQNIIILANIHDRLFFTQLLNATTYFLIYLLTCYFLIKDRFSSGFKNIIEDVKVSETKKSVSVPERIKNSRLTVISIALVLLLMISSIPLSAIHNTSIFEVKNQLPMMTYMTTDAKNNQYVLQNKDTYQYSTDNNTLSFYQGNTVTYLYKNISNENYEMSGNISYKGPAGLIEPQDIFQFGKVFAGITKFVSIDNLSENLGITQQSEINVSKLLETQNLGCYFLAQKGTDIFQLNGSSYFRSNLNYSLLIGKTVYFLLGIRNLTTFDSPVFSLKSGNLCDELYLNKSSFYFGPIPASTSSIPYTEFPSSYLQTIQLKGGTISASWNLLGISYLNSTTGLLLLNGIKIPIHFNENNNSTTLTLGEQQIKTNSSLPEYLHQTTYFATLPYVFNESAQFSSQGIYYRNYTTIKLFPMNNGNISFSRIPFIINTIGNKSRLSIGNLDITFFNHMQYIAFGQVESSSFEFSMQISFIQIQKEKQTINYTIIILINAFFLPLSVFLIWAYDAYRRDRS